MMPSEEDYEQAITFHNSIMQKLSDYIKWHEQQVETLRLAQSQLEPDGNNCAVCGDNDHQAWECHHNPLSRSYAFTPGQRSAENGRQNA